MIEKRYTTLQDSLKLPLIVTGLMWGLHIIKIFGNFDWNKYGIHSRQQDGLIGIIAAPFLHSGFQHLFSNTIPLFLMMTLIGLFYTRVAKISFITIYLLTGISVWLFGRPVYHIGASGVVYGLISFVFWSGVFRKNFRAIILSVVIVFLYSGYIVGVFPGKPGISWESHLLGAFVGILIAFILRNVEENHERDERINESLDQENIEENYFFDRDVFDDVNIQ